MGQAKQPPTKGRGRVTTSSERCYHEIRALFLAGQLPDGIRLGELEWAERLRTNRAAVREALTLLWHEGALRRGSGGGFFTPIFEERDFAEVFEARAVLEVGALRLVHARNLSEEALQPLSEICDTMDRLANAEMVLGFLEADRKFHEKLIELTDNKHLVGMYRRATLPHRLPRATDPVSLRENFEATLDDHRGIHRLLVQRQISEVVALMERHLEMCGKLVPIF